MKKLSVIIIAIFALCSSEMLPIGVAVVDAQKKTCLKLEKSAIKAVVDNQVAIVTSTQTFRNTGADSVGVKYAFPLPNGASSISLRFRIEGVWYNALMSSGAQDTTLPGEGGGSGGSETIIDKYLGKYPVYYDIPDKIKSDSTLTVEITYVQLLDYEWGEVHFVYAGNYGTIQYEPLEEQIFEFEIFSKRTIDSLVLLGHNNYQTIRGENSRGCKVIKRNKSAYDDYNVMYKLNTDEMGLFAFSNYMVSAPDSLDRGFLLFVAEPDPTENTKAIKKRFTLIIDRSGSMSGSKIVQARNAAKFIVENLNSDDYFNIFDFDDDINSFKESHVPFNFQNKTDALNYINNLYDDGMTNIGGVFDAALRQFPDTNNSETKDMANIILFFTDGMPTAGITSTNELINYINNANKKKNVTIYPFGIGYDVNKPLLSHIAENNNGMAGFVEADKLEESISNFYLCIRNPVLIQPKLSFRPNIIKETFPRTLPNLYKGHQLMITGRYAEPSDSLGIKLSGTAFGKYVEYNYSIKLANSQNQKYDFLSKVWAKLKIEQLARDYNKYSSYSEEAKKIKDSIVFLSLRFKVLTEFTSYKGNDDGYIPVELFEFGAEIINNKIILNWATASETNNYGFFVERRLKGEEDWDRLGFVKGAGNSDKALYYAFEDKNLIPKKVYQYRLVQVDLDGGFFAENYSDVISVNYAVDIFISLMQNYPNPFQNSTKIDYTVEKESKVVIDILDINGRIVRELISDKLPAGKYASEWDGRDSSGDELPAGSYICRLANENDTKLIIMTLSR